MSYKKIDKYLSYKKSESWNGRIKVNINKKGNSISERLFGLFTEHLGKNVYGGAWADLLANGGFENMLEKPENVSENKIPNLSGKTDERLKRLAEQFDIPELVKYKQTQLAPYWSPIDENNTNFSLDTGINGLAQKIKLEEKKKVGIETPIYLPIHRIQSYEFKIKLKLQKLKENKLPKSFKCQIYYLDGKEIGEYEDQGEHLEPFGLDYGGPITEVDERLVSEKIIRILPETKPNTWLQLESILKIENKNIPAGARFKFRIIVQSPGIYLFDQAQLFPTDSIYGWDPEVIDLLREAKISVLRFPGGNFVSGYNWQDGIGPLEKRPEKPNPAWPEWECNHVGTDEWLKFCELVGAEPMICVNAGNGNAEEASNWVKYCNDPVKTKWGKLRAKNGHPTPYNVLLWEVGNELWGDFQINWATDKEYSKRFNKFASAMKEADDSIKLIAVGGSMPDVILNDTNKQNEGLLGANYSQKAIQSYKGDVWAIAEHAVMGGGIPNYFQASEIYSELLAHTHQVGKLIKKNEKKLNEIGSKALIAQTEQMLAVFGFDLPTDESITAGLVWAGFMNWFLRSDGSVTLFTRSALINHGDVLKKVRGVTYPLPGYWSQFMYANHNGKFPVKINMESPLMDVGGEYFKSVKQIPSLDAVGLLNEEEDKLVVLIVNRHPEKNIKTEVKINNMIVSKLAIMEILGGNSFVSKNYWDNQDNVSPLIKKIKIEDNKTNINIPPHSILSIKFDKSK